MMTQLGQIYCDLRCDGGSLTAIVIVVAVHHGWIQCIVGTRVSGDASLSGRYGGGGVRMRRKITH